MATWAKVKIYYDNLLGQEGTELTPDSTASGDYSADYLYNMLETNMWKAGADTDPQYITLDTGTGDARASADYLIIYGHNLGKISACAVLQYSDDGTSYSDAFTPEMLRSDKAYLKEFTKAGPHRYWRLKITGHKAEPEISICSFGASTELDYASSSFDPNGQESKANVNLSYGGVVTGIHTLYTERSLSLKFDDVNVKAKSYLADGSYRADGSLTASGTEFVSLYEKIKHWWENSGMKNFFVGWETAGNPGEVFLMRPDGSFKNPLKSGGAYRDIVLKLKGRKE